MEEIRQLEIRAEAQKVGGRESLKDKVNRAGLWSCSDLRPESLSSRGAEPAGEGREQVEAAAGTAESLASHTLGPLS